MAPEPSAEERILLHYQALLRHVGDAHAPSFVDVDLTMAQAKVLYVVNVNPGMTMSALADELSVGPSAVSGLVDRLVGTGCLDRVPGTDRRQQLVTVTEAGATALDHLRELRVELVHRLVRGLDPAELRALETALLALDREAQHLDEADAAS
jgi:DNA-binding MarR family transcriptional regulator